MRCLLRTVRRKSKGVVSRQDEDFQGEQLTIGRGTNQNLKLRDDLRVALHHAKVLATGPGKFVIQSAVVPSGIRHNDELVPSAALAVGDRVGIGSYRITVLPREPGYDLVLEIERLRGHPGKEFQERASGARTRKAHRFGVRAWSWTLGLATPVLFLAVPLLGYNVETLQRFLRTAVPAVSDHAWSTGDLSTGHRNFSDKAL